MPILRLFLLSLIITSLSACGPQPPQQSPVKRLIKVGDPFPVLKLLDLNRNPVTTSRYQGRPLVVNIWATWCAPCRQELPALQRMQEKLREQAVAVIGVSVDSDDHLVREFLIDRKIHFENFLDVDMKVANEVLGVVVFPATYLVGKDGVVREVIEGEREWDSNLQMAQVLRAVL